MLYDLIKYVVGMIIVMLLFSVLYKKQGVTSVSRTIKLTLVVVGSLFFIIFVLGLIFLIKNNTIENFKNGILPLTIMFLTAMIVFLVAIFKKDFTNEFKQYALAKSKENSIEKNIDIFLWLLWISLVIVAIIALKTYSLYFFILAGLLFIIILVIRFKRGY